MDKHKDTLGSADVSTRLIDNASNTPFVLLASLRVKPDRLEEYLELAKKTDTAVKESEPGMLLHTFDADPSDPCAFTWTEVYQNDAALLAHLNNPKLDEYLKGHEEMGDGLEVEIYGALTEDTIQFLNDSGIPWTHHSTRFGFFEDFGPRKIL
tara:strand:+ start:466 stop:924 length:459 start_codon:yes stop_codon:yes gene_type:complete